MDNRSLFKETKHKQDRIYLRDSTYVVGDMEYWKDHTRTLNEQVGYFGYSLRLKSYSFHDSETNKVLIVDQDILDKEGNYVSTLRYDFRGVNENNPASKITECVKNIGNEDNKGESRTERHFQNNPIDDGN